MPALPFETVARLPHPGDNVAIALRRLEVGTSILIGAQAAVLNATILEGHRFAALPIAVGAPLLSWSMPFGYAVVPIRPGDAICNAQSRALLAQRDLAGAVLPPVANFEDRVVPFSMDEASFRPAAQVPLDPEAWAVTFSGFPRGGGRGVGVRNQIVILGTSSRTAALVRAIAAKLQTYARGWPNWDGIVAVGHTEGGGSVQPNNHREVLKILAGFMVNPNVGAVIAVDQGGEAINNRLLEAYMRESGYPLADTPHRFMTVPEESAAAIEEIERQVKQWAVGVGAETRVPCPLAALRIGLQCGGSDAFSGISANPLVGCVGKAIIRLGGAVNLAETDELVGAESYTLAKVKDWPTAQRVLQLIAGFKERLGWHGATVEGNPSGGNRLRGLYNINLKSLGAAMKKDPEVRLDHAIDYGDLMRAPGFYFMNSPGNDLESVAGQVAAGCNLIFFTTGNGSVTNFPYVPTIKVTTTTRRHLLLSHEMDVNAGAYLDGTPMEELTRQMVDLVRRVASGERTKGEQAGHSQVSMWREWRQTSTANLPSLKSRPVPTGMPVGGAGCPQPAQAPDRVSSPNAGSAQRVGPAPRSLGVGGDNALHLGPPQRVRNNARHLGLIIPTSLCSSQIARLAAGRLNQNLSAKTGLSYVALPHTEGCGFAGEMLYALLKRTFRAYATHPAVARALFLEHGCEKIPNDAMRLEMIGAELDPADFGWASVQLDGGIEAVQRKIEGWFADGPLRAGSGPGASLALMAEGDFTAESARDLGALAADWVSAGSSVVLAENDPLLASESFRRAAGLPAEVAATLLYGQPIEHPGFHVVRTESKLWAENLTGLGASGAVVVVALTNGPKRPAHPFVPVVTVADGGTDDLAERIAAALGGREIPELVDFQLTRGELGVST